ncbi:hypothetical protein J7I91_21930 [Pseudomonas sp. ISL-84]|nr:hypothetical protein [Pseudomonas sp. ISL-84]
MANVDVSTSCASPTSIRQALQEGVFSFRKGLAYDLEGLGAEAGQKKKWEGR